jgi:hypothetical protein
MNALLDAGAAGEAHLLADLVATFGELIDDYGQAHYSRLEPDERTLPQAATDYKRFFLGRLRGIVRLSPMRSTSVEIASRLRTYRLHMLSSSPP